MKLLCTSLILLLSPIVVLGCSCGGGGGPACSEAWSESPATVFLGKVTAITGTSTHSVHFLIEDALLGRTEKTLTVQTPGSEAGCGYHFQRGKRYVVYAYKTGEQFQTGLCTHTRPAEYAEEDISYFHSLPALPPLSRIFGSLKKYTFDPNFKPKFQPSIMDHYRPSEEEYRAMIPLSGQSIVVKGADGEHRSRVDATGKWEISGLQPGEYSVTAGLPASMELLPYYWKVTVAPRGCAQVDIRAMAGGHISGHIVVGTPAPDWTLLTVFVLRKEDNPDLDVKRKFRDVNIHLDTSEFDLGPLPPGHYVLGVYLVKEVQLDDGYMLKDTFPTFYSDVEKLSDAKLITLEEGTKVAGIQLSLLNTVLPTESDE